MSGIHHRGNDRGPKPSNHSANDARPQSPRAYSPLTDLILELKSRYNIEVKDPQLLSRGVGFPRSQEPTIWTHENLSYFGYGVLTLTLADWVARSNLHASYGELVDLVTAARDQRFEIAYTSGLYDLLTTSGSSAISNAEMADRVCGLVAALYLDTKKLTPAFSLVTTSSLVDSKGALPDFSLPPTLAKVSSGNLNELKSTVQNAINYRFSDAPLLEQSLMVLCRGESRSCSWPALCFVGYNVIKLAISDRDISMSPKSDNSNRIARVDAAIKDSENLLRNPVGVPLAEAFLICSKGAEPETRESTLHALIGAMYWDAGLPTTLTFMRKLLRSEVIRTTPTKDRKKARISGAVIGPATNDPINELRTLLEPYSHPLKFERIEVGSRAGPRPGAKIHFPKHMPVQGVGDTFEEAEIDAARNAIKIFDQLRQHLKQRR